MKTTLNGEEVGRGTRIARIAKPIARGIDNLLGTNVANCRGCKQMQEDLDAGMNFLDATIKRMKGRKHKL